MGADGSVHWEQGSNRVKYVMQDEAIDGGVFQKNVIDASNQQLQSIITDQERVFEVLPSVTEMIEKDEKITSLYGVIADMRGEIVSLQQALDDAQSELAAVRARAETDAAVNVAIATVETATAGAADSDATAAVAAMKAKTEPAATTSRAHKKKQARASKEAKGLLTTRDENSSM